MSLVVSPTFLPVVVLALSACSAPTPDTPAVPEVEASIAEMNSQLNDTTITVDCPDDKVRLSSRFGCTATDISGGALHHQRSHERGGHFRVPSLHRRVSDRESVRASKRPPDGEPPKVVADCPGGSGWYLYDPTTSPACVADTTAPRPPAAGGTSARPTATTPGTAPPARPTSSPTAGPNASRQPAWSQPRKGRQVAPPGEPVRAAVVVLTPVGATDAGKDEDL